MTTKFAWYQSILTLGILISLFSVSLPALSAETTDGEKQWQNDESVCYTAKPRDAAEDACRDKFFPVFEINADIPAGFALGVAWVDTERLYTGYTTSAGVQGGFSFNFLRPGSLGILSLTTGPEVATDIGGVDNDDGYYLVERIRDWSFGAGVSLGASYEGFRLPDNDFGNLLRGEGVVVQAFSFTLAVPVTIYAPVEVFGTDIQIAPFLKFTLGLSETRWYGVSLGIGLKVPFASLGLGTLSEKLGLSL